MRSIEATVLLADIARFDAPEPARRRDIHYRGAAAPREAHLYIPAQARAALVLVPGAAEAGRNDLRLIDFAHALRDRGFLVLVPALAGEDALQVSAADSAPIADAVRYLTGAAGFEEVGLAALSYAVGPTIVAALEEDVRLRVAFILAIGGYHDILAAITYITTGAFRTGPDAPWRLATPDPRARWVFLRANAGRLEDRGDAAALEAIAERRLADPEADIASLAATLGEEGRPVFRLFANDDPGRVPEFVAGLPPRFRDEIRALDLASRDLDRLAADLLLIHGRADLMVPYTESLGLAAAVPQGQASLYLIDGLDHVDIGALGASDITTLLRAAYRVLLERDAVPPPAALPVMP